MSEVSGAHAVSYVYLQDTSFVQPNQTVSDTFEIVAALGDMRSFYLHKIEVEGYHTNPNVLPDGTSELLMRGSHHPLSLASLVVDHLAAMNHTTPSAVAAALTEWDQVKQQLYQPGQPLTLPSPAEMKQIIHIFNRIFFFDKLTRLDFRWKHHLYRITGRLGQACPNLTSKRYRSRIEIESHDLHLQGQPARSLHLHHQHLTPRVRPRLLPDLLVPVRGVQRSTLCREAQASCGQDFAWDGFPACGKSPGGVCTAKNPCGAESWLLAWL